MANYILAGLNYIFGKSTPLVSDNPGHGEGLNSTSSISRGWGDKIVWRTLNEAFTTAKTEYKPVMVVIHKETCPACRYQKTWFSNSKKIELLSKDFVMVNLEVYEVPKLPEYTPDGLYVPRILFFSPAGRFLPDVKINHNSQYKYNYPGEFYLANNMKNVVDRFRIK